MLEYLIKQSEVPNSKINARERSRLETRRRLLLAGAKQFSKNGFEQTSISAIAKEAEVATGTIFFHFKNKEGLFREIGVYFLGGLHSKFIESNKIPADTWEQNLRNHTEYGLAFIEENREVFTMIIRRLVLRTEFGVGINRALVKEQEDRFREGIAEGIFRDDINIEVAAQATVGMWFTVINWWLNSTNDVSREDLVDAITKLRSSMLSTAINT